MSISDQIKTEPDAYKMRNLIAEGIKENKDISDSANSTAQEAKDTADNANNRVNNIISGQIEGKDQEILDAHYSNVTGQTSANIGSRMDGFDSQLADIATLFQFPKVDGDVDDTNRIQRAINYCISNNLTLIIPQGSYTVSQQGTVTLNWGTNLIVPYVFLINSCLNIINYGIFNCNFNNTVKPNLFIYKNVSTECKIKGIYYTGTNNSNHTLYTGEAVLLDTCKHITVEKSKTINCSGNIMIACVDCHIKNSYADTIDYHYSGSTFGIYGSSYCTIKNCISFGGTSDGDITLFGNGHHNKIIDCKAYNKKTSDDTIPSAGLQGFCVDSGQYNSKVINCYAYGYFYGYDIKTNINGCEISHNTAESCKVSYTARLGEGNDIVVYAKFHNNKIVNPNNNGNSTSIMGYTIIGIFIENAYACDIENNIFIVENNDENSYLNIGVNITTSSSRAYNKYINIKNNTFNDESRISLNSSRNTSENIVINDTNKTHVVNIIGNEFTGVDSVKTTNYIIVNGASLLVVKDNNFNGMSLGVVMNLSNISVVKLNNNEYNRNYGVANLNTINLCEICNESVFGTTNYANSYTAANVVDIACINNKYYDIYANNGAFLNATGNTNLLATNNFGKYHITRTEQFVTDASSPTRANNIALYA